MNDTSYVLFYKKISSTSPFNHIILPTFFGDENDALQLVNSLDEKESKANIW
jgi:hypothetical protein